MLGGLDIYSSLSIYPIDATYQIWFRFGQKLSSWEEGVIARRMRLIFLKNVKISRIDWFLFIYL